MATTSFMLTNKTGGYTLLSARPMSKYEGIHFFSGSDMFKVMSGIRHAETPRSIVNNRWNAQRFYDHFSERFFMPHSFNSFVYQVDTEKEFDLLLDIKKSYDNREWGRNYAIEKKKDIIIISFTKTTSAHEDPTDGDIEYRCYLAILGADGTINDSWIEEQYPYDEYRESRPYSRYVYNALTLKGRKVVFSFSFDKGRAEAEVRHVYRRLGQIMEKQHHYTDKLLYESHLMIHEEDRKRAYDSSVIALDSMTARIEGSEGIFAGLPWFFQFWTRDEAISLRALMQIEKLQMAEKILFRQLSALRHDGRMPNRFPASDLASADGAGWSFARTGHFLELIQKKHILKRFMSIGLKKRITSALCDAIYHQKKFFGQDGLIHNQAKETWMDTDYKGDTREGFRIEIQTLFLAMLKLRYELTGIRKHLDEELEFKENVRTSFLQDGMLMDGRNDRTIRPNVFLAYYLYPDLLSRNEWEKTFDRALARLWLDWGGLSSIDKTHPLYHEEYTAEQDKSYHRGDSWYWMNNLAGICLHRLNAERYADKIECIINASTKEILLEGIDGYHAEVSSAGKQTSAGCLAQTWSSAMFIELMHETYGK